MIVEAGSTNVITYWKLVDSAAFTPEPSLTVADIDLTYIRDGAAAVKADLSTPGGYTAASAHADNAAIAVDATNAPGVYRVDVPDAAFAAGVDHVTLVINASGVDPSIMCVDISPAVSLAATQGAVSFGQVKITGTTPGEGALHIVSNAVVAGYGIYASGNSCGQYNIATGTGSYGVYNSGVSYGQANQSSGTSGIGQYNFSDGTSSTGQANQGALYGTYNYGSASGTGILNSGAVGQDNSGTTNDITPQTTTRVLDPTPVSAVSS